MSILLVVRPRDRWRSSMDVVQSHGHEALCAEVVQVRYVRPPEMEDVKNDILNGNVHTVVFASVTAVKAVEASDPGMIRSIPDNVKVVAIGPPTANALSKAGNDRATVPKEYTSEGLVDLLSGEAGDVVLLRSGQGSDVLMNGLEGVRPLREVIVYDLVETDWDSVDAALAELFKGRVAAVLHTSSLSARMLVERSKVEYPNDWRSCWKGVNAAIGPPTRDALTDMGITVQVMPQNATFNELVKAVSAYLRKIDLS